MSVKYLVTGAAGHLGNTIVRQLIKEGKFVRALALPQDRNAEQLPKEAEVFIGDVTNKLSLYPFFHVNQDDEIIVIHAAGIVTIASRYNQKVYDVNVNGTKNIVELCQEHKVRKLVHISSVHAIPELSKGQVIREAKEFSPDKVIGLYAKTKAEATAFVLDAHSKGLNVSVIHPSGISGPFDYGRGYLTQLLIDYNKGHLTAGIKGGYDFVDVRDVANGIISCCEKGRSGECYILSNRFYSIQELFELFHKVNQKREIKTILPMWFAKVTAPLSELYYKILRQPPLYTPYSLYTLSSNSLFSHEKADSELGYTVRPFIETISDTTKWLKSQNRL